MSWKEKHIIMKQPVLFACIWLGIGGLVGAVGMKMLGISETPSQSKLTPQKTQSPSISPNPKLHETSASTKSLREELDEAKSLTAELQTKNEELEQALKEALPDLVLPNNPKEIGSLMGQMRKRRYELSTQFPHGTPDRNSSEYEEYALAQDALIRDSAPLTIARREMRDAMQNAYAELHSSELQEALGLDKGKSLQIQNLIDQEIAGSLSQGFDPTSRPEDRKSRREWYRQRREWSKTLDSKIMQTLSPDQQTQYEAMYSRRSGNRWRGF